MFFLQNFFCSNYFFVLLVRKLVNPLEFYMSKFIFPEITFTYLFFRNLFLFSKFFRNLFIRSLFFRNVLRKKLVCLVLFGVCVTRKHFCESKYIFKLIVLFEYKRDFELIFYSNNFVIIFKNLPLK